MKKLLLVTGIFLSLGLMASAQQKKSLAPATTTTQTQAPQKKKTIKDVKAENKAQKTAVKLKKAEAKKKAVSVPGAKDSQDAKAN